MRNAIASCSVDDNFDTDNDLFLDIRRLIIVFVVYFEFDFDSYHC